MRIFLLMFESVQTVHMEIYKMMAISYLRVRTSMTFKYPGQWSLGPYIIYADNPFIARRAYEQLKEYGSQLERNGAISLDTGEKVTWINLALRPV